MKPSLHCTLNEMIQFVAHFYVSINPSSTGPAQFSDKMSHKIFSISDVSGWIIGVNDKTTENVWQFNSGGNITFKINWSRREPSNHGGGENCVEVYKKDKSWNDIPCTQSTGSTGSSLRPSICENAAAIEWYVYLCSISLANHSVYG